MKRLRNLAVAGCSLFLLCQCASQDEIQDLQYQVRAVNQKVEEVRSTTVGQMQKRQASSVSRIDEVQNEVLQLRATVEENAHQETRYREQTKENIAGLQLMIEKMQAENDRRLKSMEDKISQSERNLDKMSQARIREAEDRAHEAARRAEEARKRTVIAAAASGGVINLKPDDRKKKVDSSQKDKAVATTKPSTGDSGKKPEIAAPVQGGQKGDIFSQGVALYKGKQYTEAYKTFEKVLSQNPRGDRAAETLFYMAESLYGRGEYDLAILDYQKVISNHAKHKRTPTALLKQGMSFEKLTDHETAKIIYKKLISEYPDSPEATTAEQQLARLQ